MSPTVPAANEPHVVLYGISFDFYKTFVAAVGARPSLRLTFDGKNLEIMTISPLHEIYKRLLGNLIVVMAMELKLPIKCCGAFTFTRVDLERGLEPDECFYVKNERVVRGRTDIDFSRDPVPDLAVEVEVSRNVLNRLSIYASFGVPELWRFDGETLRAFYLRPDGEYEPREQSPSFPFLPLAELVPFIQRGVSTDDVSILLEFRDWVREHILPAWPGPVES
ncbi:MAG: Uma2 family endonuclease [Gemmataceae bacterium]|nr:Uma2 family endonuclease [Gemmataceae bacterium]